MPIHSASQEQESRKGLSRSIPTTVLVALAGLVIVIAYLCFNWVSALVRSLQHSDGAIAYVLMGVVLILGLVVPFLGIWATLTRRRWAPIVVSAVALWMLTTVFFSPNTVASVAIALVSAGATVAAWLPATRSWLASRTPRHDEGA